MAPDVDGVDCVVVAGVVVVGNGSGQDQAGQTGEGIDLPGGDDGVDCRTCAIGTCTEGLVDGVGDQPDDVRGGVGCPLPLLLILLLLLRRRRAEQMTVRGRRRRGRHIIMWSGRADGCARIFPK